MGIVMGPTTCGKSYFIKKSLRALDSSESQEKKMIIHVDLSSYPFINFEIFLNRFEQAVISQIISSNVSTSQLVDAVKHSLNFTLQPSMLKYILHRVCCNKGFAREYIEHEHDTWSLIQHMSDSISVQCVEEGLLQPIDESKEKNVLVYQDECFEWNRNKLGGLIYLLREIAIEKEAMEERVWPDNIDSEMNDGEIERVHDIQRSGIEFVDIVFDVLNYIAGYHPINNYEEHQNDLKSFIDVVLVIGMP